MALNNATAQLDRVPFPDRKSWRAWLRKNQARTPGVWLVFYKKGSEKPSVRYDEAVEEALCFGWIDSIVKALDSERYMQLFTPRKPKSMWSKSNKERIERMITQRLMTPTGLTKIEAAKRDGSWISLDAVDAVTVPADFKKALAANKKARENFERFPPGKKKQLLYWINTAKRQETRGRRIAAAVAMAAENRSSQI